MTNDDIASFVNKRVKTWIVGDDEPYVGHLTEWGDDTVSLEPILGGPQERNGRGKVHKRYIDRIELLVTQ